MNDKGELQADEVLYPPQQDMDEREERMWRMTYSEEYTN
jgi:hypothetical protein